MHGEMQYLQRHGEARRHPSSVLHDVKTIFVVALSYAKVNPLRVPLKIFRGHAGSFDAKTVDHTTVADYGIVAEYARGLDYHDVLRAKLQQLAEVHRQLFPDAKTRIAVDTAPILEREYAMRANVGRPGKNTMLINEQCGSRFFLGVLLSTVEFCETQVESCSFDVLPEQLSPCGNCRRCVDACPTGALTPYRLDARKCLNYWSIEYQGDDIPPEIAAKFGNRLFGCEICQSVCPFNRCADQSRSQNQGDNSDSPQCICKNCQPYEKFRPKTNASQTPQNLSPANMLSQTDLTALSLREQLELGLMSLSQIESLDEDNFQREFVGTPLVRLGLARLKRNAAIVRENT